MKATRLSSRYKITTKFGGRQKKLEDTLSDMKHIKSICSENKDLSLLLKNCKNRQKRYLFYLKYFQRQFQM